MKINEILVEAGFLSKLGQGIKAGVAGYKQNQAVRQGTEELNKATDDALKRYNQFLATYTASGKKITPDVAAEWLSNYTRTKPTSKPKDVSPVQIRSWITQELGNYFSSKELGTAQPASNTAQGQQTAVPGFEVLVQDPIMIKYNKNDYVLNQNGEWISATGKGTQRPLVKDYNPTLEKLLDRVAGMEQTAPAKPKAKPAPAPNAPAQQSADVTKIATVTIPNGTRADKWSDGHWSTPENGEDVQVVDSDVPHLEQVLQQQQKKPHTGGRQKGGLSQTTNAIRQRNARAAKKEPAVFKSNRRTA